MPRRAKHNPLPVANYKLSFVLEKFLTREEWAAAPAARQDEPLEKPAQHVVLSFVKVEGRDEYNSMVAVQSLQKRDMSSGALSDIKCNFAIGVDGVIYEGRGFEARPGRSDDYPGYEGKYIEVTFLGESKDERAKNATFHLFEVAQKHKLLAKNFTFLKEDQRKRALLDH